MRNNKSKRILPALISLALVCAAAFLAAALPGDPDTTYGTTGFYFDTIPATGGDTPEGTAFFDGEVTADNKLTSVGTFSYFIPNVGYRQDFYIQRILPTGQRDPSFGGGDGAVRFHGTLPAPSESIARAVKIQQDNKIVVAGVCNIVVNAGEPEQRESGYGMCVARLLESGDLDGTFGGNEVLVQHSPKDPSQDFKYKMPAGFAYYESGFLGGIDAGALDVALHSDGRIVLAGFGATRDFDANGFVLGKNHVALVVTLNQSGQFLSRDVSPGDQTSVTARRTKGRAFNQVETQSDGKFVAAGFNLHFNDQGDIDGGRWMVYNGTTAWYSENFPNRGFATSVKLLRSNKILVAGRAYQAGLGDSNVNALMRFNSNLTPDTTFGTGGRVIYCREAPCQKLPSSDLLKLASIQNDGKILALGLSRGSPYTHPQTPEGGEILFRFNPDGSVDRSFGNAFGNNPGVAESYGYSFLRRYTASGLAQGLTDSPFGVFQADGKILAGGAYYPGSGPANRAGVMRQLNTFRNGVHSDFDNDGRSDLAYFLNGSWNWTNSFSSQTSSLSLGAAGDQIAPADYDGDGKTDPAVFRNGTWTIQQSSNNTPRTVVFGTAGDLARPGDFNGDGQADFGFFRPSTATWYVKLSNPIQPGNVTQLTKQFGFPDDIPVIGDFDGDGKSDFAVFSAGTWRYLASTDGETVSFVLGSASDVPVPGDYDGDSRTDFAVFRPSTHVWIVRSSRTGQSTQTSLGQAGDTPAPGDYDNDGRWDLAAYHGGDWTIKRTSDGQILTPSFGVPGALPVQAAYTKGGPPPALSINNVTVTEGNSGTVNANFTVKLTPASAKTVTVKYATAAGTVNPATAGTDYAAKALTTLTFAPGETAKTVTVAVAGDPLDENNETFRLLLSSPARATISDGEGVCTITDDDATPSLKVNSVAVTEGNAAVAANFTVTLSAKSGRTVTVKYQTSNATAVAPSDYAAKALTTLTFAPGETAKTVAVTVAGDTRDEATETFKLLLSSPTNATVAVGTGTCTITDNDPAPSITVTNATVTEPDTGTVSAVFTVKLSAASGQTVTVKYATANGSAAAGSDYTALALTTLTFSPGQTTKTVAVPVRGDLVKEASETFFLNLSGAVNAAVADAQGLGTITNDD